MPYTSWSGKGFGFKDGRTCCGYRVVARSASDAVKTLNRAAGWRWLKEESGLGRPKASRLQPGVWVKWSDGRWEEVDASVKSRGRLPDAQPTSATSRVRRSVQKLIESGGHRSTVRFRRQAWKDLQLLMRVSGKCQVEVLEDLIRWKADQLRKSQ